MTSGNIQEIEEEIKEEVYSAADHFSEFNPSAYLESFYKTAVEDTAMQVILFFLPGILYRLPNKIRTVLDLGAGPTVYLPISFRDRADAIYTSDYAPLNRDDLEKWITNKSAFNWDKVCEWIGNIEASTDTPYMMQQKTRQKIMAILEVDVHDSKVVKNTSWRRTNTCILPEKFQVVAAIFCLEYSCETKENYVKAVQNTCNIIEDGGYLIQGGVLNAESYCFGGKKFKCHYLKKAHIIESLKANGMSTLEEEGFKFITHEEVFILISKKSHCNS